MSDYIIKVENLGKKYKIRHRQERQKYVAFRDVIASRAAAPLRWLRSKQGVWRNGLGANQNGHSNSFEHTSEIQNSLSGIDLGRRFSPNSSAQPDVQDSEAQISSA